ncbi:MAG: UvrD-helicase domain-containing protein, partial [Lachnospiraceae bacterium]|nr:UvrD-helicase domain-containing protein [Lachnospiraceae bacterium]
MHILEGLNTQQQEAVRHFEGPLLILAGAGSGKTRVLTNRIAYMIDEYNVNPWNILAITFTNKAAGEMRERVDRIVGFGAESIWVSTFHSMCARILRRYIDLIGYDTHYVIYDTDDQKSLMKDVCKRLNIDTKVFKERSILAAISSAKNELISPEEYAATVGKDFAYKRIAEAYDLYQKELKRNNALDFDDLLVLTVRLFKQCGDVLAYYQERFRYIMVDEYQDTNTAQFELVRLLAGKYRNLCVVGDDDQSIYRFRGANIRNILDFEKTFPDTKVIRLEQNYRSTQSILDVANSVIANNKGRKRKTLWTANGAGSRVKFKRFSTAYDEAEFIARDIAGSVRSGEYTYEECAVLYRTNAQSRLIEEKLLLHNIPYKIVGGINFYARKEIKDILAYLKTIDNARDDLSVRRIINIPKRGIGAASIAKVQTYAQVNNLTFFEALEKAREIPGIGRSGAKMEDFVLFIQALRSKAKEYSLTELVDDILEKTGYVAELQAEGTDEAQDRLANIDELISKVTAYEESVEHAELSAFLEEVALVADIDTLDETKSAVVLMTLHSAKGLEFPKVYLSGMEDGLFPSYMSIV